MTIDEIYTLIATNITNSIQDESWTKAILYIHGNDAYVDTTGEYFDNCNITKALDVHSFDPTVDFGLMELHEITNRAQNEQWNRAIFTLAANGIFDMKFIWDQTLQDELDQGNS
ncbi:MAG: hypothetical protein LBF27_15100 [Sphingobacterium sp.]|jgi:hypothetical protein|nr:hypothetical protein [Sphingobacterium sp.]